jgi:hypothetical protein
VLQQAFGVYARALIVMHCDNSTPTCCALLFCVSLRFHMLGVFVTCADARACVRVCVHVPFVCVCACVCMCRACVRVLTSLLFQHCLSLAKTPLHRLCTSPQDSPVHPQFALLLYVLVTIADRFADGDTSCMTTRCAVTRYTLSNCLSCCLGFAIAVLLSFLV